MRRFLLMISVGLAFALASCSSNVPEGSEKVTETDTGVTEEEGTKPEETTAAVPESKILKGSAEGFGGTITVFLTMEGDDIVDATIEGNDETPDIGGKALNELSEQLIDKDGYEIDGVSGATYTSEGVRNAAKDALGLFLDETKEQ